MTRHLYCEACGKEQPMHPEDVAAGLKQRRLTFVARKPAEHYVTMQGERKDVELTCDSCNGDINGMPVVAVTMWRPERENEPLLWEPEFGYTGTHCPIRIPEPKAGRAHRIETLYAFIAAHPEGEGIPVMVNAMTGAPVILFGSDMERMNSYRIAAQQCANQHQMPVTLCKFENRIELEVIQPEPREKDSANE
jgi:hypothetical protein